MTDEEKSAHKKLFPKSQKKNCESPELFQAAGDTYIFEKNLERELGCSIDDDKTAFNLLWGHVCEEYAFNNILGLSWKRTQHETRTHSIIPYWVGSPDAVERMEEKAVCDIKSPATRKSFAIFNHCNGDIEKVRELHPDGEKYYWQLVSNACVLGPQCTVAELVVFMPYERDLDATRRIAETYPGAGFIARMEKLPFIPNHVKTNNLLFMFDIPQADKDFLTSRILMAGAKLH